MNLNKDLLFAQKDIDDDLLLNKSNIRGSYNSIQCVLRLRDDVQRTLDGSEMDSLKIQAMSTYIHENIHWWQHIGSNFGFLYSLSYPSFAHSSIKYLRNLVNFGIKCKSLLLFDIQYYEKHKKADLQDLNTIVNNYYDVQHAKTFAINNPNIYKLLEDRIPMSTIGHCYHILWHMNIHMLSEIIDTQKKFLPKVGAWVENFNKLEKDKKEGFYINSGMGISPIGIKAIYEGQAIFNQVQYLTANLNNDLTYSDFENQGMLHGIYIEAFELFLSITKLQKPSNLLSPVVSLFLLICDISINPNNGFPLDIYDFEGFIKKNDPGIRFFEICQSISSSADNYVNKIKKHSKEEYIELCKELSEKIGCLCPYESIKSVLDWANEDDVKQILEEEKDSTFLQNALPIRLMFSKFFRFQEDKYEYPNVFCWIGIHSTGKNSNVDFEIVAKLFHKHHALFTEDYDGEIKPILPEGCNEENTIHSFNEFYRHNLLYDMIFKWISEEGEFNYDYKWLANDRAKDFVPIMKKQFELEFNISPDDIEILNSMMK